MTQLGIPSEMSALSFGPGFMRPDYGGRCFAGLPESIAQLLGCAPEAQPVLALDQLIAGGAAPAKTVVLVLVDGFGWRFIERFCELKSIKTLLKRANAQCITAQFPSTTAAHLSTLHSGVPVTESGIYEWFYHEPVAGRLISPLIFNDARSDFDGRGELCNLGITPEQIAPWPSLYQTLQRRAAVNSFIYHSKGYAKTTSSLYMTRGAEVRPIDCIEHGFSWLRSSLRELRDSHNPAYHLLYLPEFDGLTHDHGPDSERLISLTERIFNQINSLADSLGPDTLLMITADHGHTAVDPESTVYLDHLMPELIPAIEKGSARLPLVPAGSARDFFLHLKEELRDELRENLKRRLDGTAQVYSREELIDLKLLGNPPSARFLARLGDTLVLPLAGNTVWWSEGGKFTMKFFGHHGGLSHDEMLIPLISLRS